MLQKYRHQLHSFVVTQGPLIRLCLRLIILLIFTVFCLSKMYSFTDSVKDHLWNPFRATRTQKGESRPRDFAHNLPPREDDDEILNEDPRYPRTRDWLYDHIYYSFYDGSRVYTNQEYTGGTVSRSTHHDEQLMLSQVRERAYKYFSTKSPGKYSKEHCNSIRYRIIPTVGLEADVTCNDTAAMSVDRLNIILPLRPPKVTYHHAVSPTTAINIIVTLRGRQDTLKLFMTNLVQVLRESHIRVGLTLVYFADGNEQSIRKILKDSEAEITRLKTQFILLENADFSRGMGLQEGVEQTEFSGQILFFCDVDVLFTSAFLTRCISTPVRGHQVFIPMVFSQYNPEFVYPLHKHRIPPPLKQMEVKDDHGYWRVWGHGMVCVYKEDFLKIGGFDKDRTGWGGEDLAFVRRTINARDYKIIRSLEPGLFHRYHKKECDVSGKYYSCLKMKASNEASKQAFGFWYFQQQEGLSVYGALAEGNQPHYHDEVEIDPRETESEALYIPDSIAVVSQYRSLWDSLCLLVLLSVIGLDMFLMMQNWQLMRQMGVAKDV
ncbi:chondroitin sulfate N-acetylgalactosaminyltransferase 1-like [Macrobrachium rosenbergii]|uniref:chondroitin sulfate N-acetylgalactosaminyltransferase 1-like n=1 Tax=Macrobrachium rosenbergii TaxID=79674 RepID=UPI0034D79075